MFRFTQEPSSGSNSQCVTKITGMVPLHLLVCVLSVLWRHIPTCCVCGSSCRKIQTVPSCTVNHTRSAHIDKHSATIPVILARHWLWLPDDGSCVNQNILEQLLHF